jgi:DNA repair protein RadC
VIPTLRDAARLVGITLADHLIVPPTSHYSFAAEEHWLHADADTTAGPCR